MPFYPQSGSGGAGGAGSATGLLAARPAPGTVLAGYLYFATDTGLLYRSDGIATWLTEAYGPGASVDSLHPDIHGAAKHVGFITQYDFPCTVDLSSLNTVALTWSAANRGVYMRSLGGGSVSTAFFTVTTQSGNMCVAVYSNSGVGRGSLPGTLLATTGSFACPAAGQQSQALGATIQVNAGDWIYLGCDNAVAAFRSTATALAIAAGLTGTNAGRYYYHDAAFPAPASNPTPTGTCASQMVGVALG